MKSVLEELCVVVHASLVVGHTLGAIYNGRSARRVDRWVLFHSTAAIVSAYAVHVHAKRLRAG